MHPSNNENFWQLEFASTHLQATYSNKTNTYIIIRQTTDIGNNDEIKT